MRDVTEELLREASDPTTSSERLRELAMSGAGGRQAGLHALQNPSLPLDVLRETLQDVTAAMGRLTSAWRNPSVPLLLLHEPSSEYGEAARDLLVQMTLESERPLLADRPLRLDAYVSAWASLPCEPSAPRDERRKEGYRQCRTFARYLAGLFGLPWAPEGARPESAPAPVLERMSVRPIAPPESRSLRR